MVDIFEVGQHEMDHGALMRARRTKLVISGGRLHRARLILRGTCPCRVRFSPETSPFLGKSLRFEASSQATSCLGDRFRRQICLAQLQVSDPCVEKGGEEW